MKRAERKGSFLPWLLVNLILNAGWSIPGWVLLALHLRLGLSLWWALGAFGLWVLATLLSMLLVIGAANTQSPAERRRTNKKPPENGPQ